MNQNVECVVCNSSTHITDKVYVKFKEEERGATISSLSGKPFVSPTMANTPILQTELINEYPGITNAGPTELSELLVLIAKKLSRQCVSRPAHKIHTTYITETTHVFLCSWVQISEPMSIKKPKLPIKQVHFQTEKS